MSPRNIKWGYVAIFALLSIGIVSLAYYSYDNLGLRRPLERAILQDPDVLWVEIDDDKEGLIIEVELALVEDLGLTHEKIRNIAKDKGVYEFRLIVRDNREQEIQDAYRSIHYYLQEAAMRGNFGTMIESCRNILDYLELTGYEISVDKKHIYVQIVQNDRYLYEIIDISVGKED